MEALDLNRYFSKEDIQMANMIEKILNITYHMGSTNQNDKIPVYTIQMAVIKKEREMLVKMWRNWDPCTRLVRMQYCVTGVENSIKIPQNL